jgi:hypothetical protein
MAKACAICTLASCKEAWTAWMALSSSRATSQMMSACTTLHPYCCFSLFLGWFTCFKLLHIMVFSTGIGQASKQLCPSILPVHPWCPSITTSTVTWHGGPILAWGGKNHVVLCSCVVFIYRANPAVMFTFLFNFCYWNSITGLQLEISNYFTFVSNQGIVAISMVWHLSAMCSIFFFNNFCIFFNSFYIHQCNTLTDISNDVYSWH